MGHSWSLYVCQRSIERRAASVPELAGCTLMRDRGPSVILRPTASGDTMKPEPTESTVPPRQLLRIYDLAMGAHYYISVDNLGIMSTSADDAKRRLDGIIRALESYGLIVHETEVSTGKIQTLGVELDCAALATRVTRARRSRLCSALKALCRRRTATGEMLQVIIGHCTFCGLVRRPSLSVFSTVYS